MTQPAPPVEPAAEPSLAGYEAAFAAAVLVALTAWLASVQLAVLAVFVRWGLAPDADALGSRKPDWIDHVDSLMPNLLDIARLGWNQAQKDLGSRIPFEPGNQILQDQLSKTRNFLVRISDEVYKDIVNALNSAVAAGAGIEEQSQAVRRVLDVSGSENWPSRARTIAVTEVNRAFGFGGLAHGMTVSQRGGGVIWKMWDSKEDRHVRAAHNEADSQVVGINEPFIVGGEALMAPGDPSGSPWNVINCVPGTAEIVASGVQGGFRYFYQGKLIQVTLRSGDRLTMSPNHPILAERGWILASQIKEGEHLVKTSQSRSRLGSLIVDPDVETQPSLAADVFDSLLKAGIAERMIGLSVDFHGDGPDGDVDVVFVDRELSFGLDVGTEQHFEQLCLAFADLPDSSGGLLEQTLTASRNASDGSMSPGNLMGSDLGAHPGPLGSLGLALVSQNDADLGESRAQGLPGDADLLGELVCRFPREVSLDEVVEIRDDEFSGHLYTFQTSSGVYIADASVSHNCRCRMRLRRA